MTNQWPGTPLKFACHACIGAWPIFSVVWFLSCELSKYTNILFFIWSYALHIQYHKLPLGRISLLLLDHGRWKKCWDWEKSFPALLFPTVQANNADCLFLLTEKHFLDVRTEGAAHESTGYGNCFCLWPFPLNLELDSSKPPLQGYSFFFFFLFIQYTWKCYKITLK